jgi:fructuronate reductase
LRQQNYLYSLAERTSGSAHFRVIGSLADVLVAAEAPDAVITALAQPSTHLVTLTVTEKGYCRNPLTGGIDLHHPDIAHDLAHPDRPRSAPGLLLQGLRRRWQRAIATPTLVSCDNLPQNGRVLKRVLVELAQAADPDVAEWIERAVSCPCTVVDRIVPATTASDIESAATTIGALDQAPVKTEPFTQWVIEDRFTGPRPRLEVAGAQFVSNVRPFESAKLRLLNGSHSALAYLGRLAGFSFVHDVIAEPEFFAFIRYLMQSELAPTLEPANGLDIASYQSALLTRFSNSALEHRLEQIAADGSQKIPLRILQPLLVRLREGRSCDALTLIVAGWMRYVLRGGELGRHHAVDDPLAEKFAAIAAASSQHPRNLVDRFLELPDVFGDELPRSVDFRENLTKSLSMLVSFGARTAVSTVARRQMP